MNTSWITQLPRLKLGFLPTPLVPLERLGTRLGGPRLWLKRDDCTGLATGGNKTRKLEYLLADAQHAGADVIVTFGAVQSNHARQTAAACAAAGIDCHLILSRRVRWPHPSYETAGNVLMDRLLGATIHLTAPGEVASTARTLLAKIKARGQQPYVIPTGGSNGLGAMGYARCALELEQQAAAAKFQLTDVLHASSSAGTQAGLLAGFAGMIQAPGAAPRVHGINVYEQDPATLKANVAALASEVLARWAPHAGIAQEDIRVDHRYFGTDYGIPTRSTLDAIQLLARTEGILLDPVYSGKAFSALVDRTRRGEFDDVHDLVFIHTGGVASLGVYEMAFADVRD